MRTQNIFINKKPYSFGLTKKNISGFMFKRTMLTTRIIKPFTPNPLLGQIRNYPNKFSAGHLGYQARTGNGTPGPGHEYAHTLVIRNSDGQLIGAFTTKPKETFKNTLLDDKEYVNGNQVPSNSPEGTGQYLAFFDKPKIIDSPAYETQKPIFKTDPKYQVYLDKREKVINDFLEKTKQETPELRLHKDDSRFYHENGQRDYENFP